MTPLPNYSSQRNSLILRGALGHLQQHAKHDFPLSIELAHRVRPGDDLAKVVPLAEQIDRHRDQCRSYEEFDGLAAGVEALAELENPGHVDDGPVVKIIRKN